MINRTDMTGIREVNDEEERPRLVNTLHRL